MVVDNIIVCPSCNKVASWSMYFQRYVCPYCGGEAFLRRLYTNYIIDAKHNENCPMSILPLPHDTHWVTREAACAAWNLRRYCKAETTKMGDEING